jgi:hypothetical protein
VSADGKPGQVAGAEPDYWRFKEGEVVMAEPEVDAMGKIAEAMASLEDQNAKMRVLQWACARYGVPEPAATRTVGRVPTVPASAPNSLESAPAPNGGLEDIVEQNQEGRIRVIARDIKARSKNDAALRLAHIVIYAHEKLTGEATVSSKRVLIPVLRDWRAYDPNTRVAIARNQGIVREGDELHLDQHAKMQAERFIAEIRDERTEGQWSPSKVGRKKGGKKATKADE